MALRNNDLQEDLIDELRCPVCVDIMHPPVTACFMGHNFCNNCDKKLSTCPYCRGAKGPRRNFSLENIHNKLVLPCNNRSKGCMFISKGDRIVQHEKICSYKEDNVSLDSSSLNYTTDNWQDNTTTNMDTDVHVVDGVIVNSFERLLARASASWRTISDHNHNSAENEQDGTTKLFFFGDRRF